MSYQEQIPRKPVTRKDMLKRVARFSQIKGSDGGLPDSQHPSAERVLYNVIGFQPPPAEEGGMVSPVGDKAARMSAIKISEGFNLGFCRALPGKGPMMHNHDTNETFIAITGKWRASWEDPKGRVEHIDLDPLDVISFPPGVIRRFENVSKGSRSKYSTLMFVIAGNAPAAEFTREAMAELAAAGLLDDSPRKRGKVHSTATAAAKPAASKQRAAARPGGAPAKRAATKAAKAASGPGKPAARAARRRPA
ncbi:MAG: cupin domain-containing protein [Gammaproteobacteria bacterium]